MNYELEQKILTHMKKDAAGHRDFGSIYKDRDLMKNVIDFLAEPFKGKIDYVAAPGPMGFMLGSMLAVELNVGFIPIRNGALYTRTGALYTLEDDECVRASYIDHNNQPKMLQIRKDAELENCKVLLVDDWIDTAATMYACKTLVEDIPGTVVGIATIGTKNSETARALKQEGELRSIVMV
ncbi:MAG: hypothetical protein MJ097_03160 [Dorea sp.]|nr:hypothetical protein [Dorea sp.]